MLIPCVPIQSSCNFGASDSGLDTFQEQSGNSPGLDTIHKKNNKEIDVRFGHFLPRTLTKDRTLSTKRTLTLDGTPSIITEDLRNCV